MKKPLFMQIPTFRDQAEQRIIAAPAELAVISYWSMTWLVFLF